MMLAYIVPGFIISKLKIIEKNPYDFKNIILHFFDCSNNHIFQHSWVAFAFTFFHTLTYKEALKNTTIFTTTVMFDTEKIKKERIRQNRNNQTNHTQYAIWRLNKYYNIDCYQQCKQRKQNCITFFMHF